MENWEKSILYSLKRSLFHRKSQEQIEPSFCRFFNKNTFGCQVRYVSANSGELTLTPQDLVLWRTCTETKDSVFQSGAKSLHYSEE